MVDDVPAASTAATEHNSELQQNDTAWKVAAVKLFDNKPACIGLRRAEATTMLQSASLPQTPNPTSTRADMIEAQARGTRHAHENAAGQYEYKLLLYWARSEPVARVHMATVPERRARRGLRATWTLQCMTQLGCYDLPGCRGCGHYPTRSTCSNCCTAWCHECRKWSPLCWKCYRPRHCLVDAGGFVDGCGGPGGNGSFDTPL